MIAEKLLSHGLPPETPVALIENGCRPEQRDIIGSLHELPTLVQTYRVQSPALIVVGDVVQMAGQLRSGVELDLLNQSCA